MPQPPEKEIEVFNLALELPAQGRAEYLDKACAGDLALRQRVEELLKASEELCPCLEDSLAVSPEVGGKIRVPILSEVRVGDRIGRYKLLQQIGQGGCGVVYMADQEEPVRRKVALKVIKLGMDTKSVIARFEAERQALALMDHPNIAKVLDAGATDTGRPYFVMELVRGVKITDYCDGNKLSTAARLKLFIQVCQAIQHAHQKGIIHRDIKPSNVLVADHDGVPVPNIIDFGIAKATTDQRLTDKTLFTAFEQFLGTPAYMSPEQAKLTGLDIDTRSDIYSLGVLLYELLTGKTPFESKRLFEAGLDEVRRIIREEEPARPSTKVETLDAAEQTTVAAHRQCDPPKLAHLIRGDLDWIAMKCLEKDRSRRYETANGLAADIQRHLSNEPVVARPPSSLYRLQKLARRNKLAVTAGCVVIAALVGGIGIATWSFFKEQQARQKAEAQGKIAMTEAAKATAISDFFQQSLRAANPDESKSTEYTVRQLLDDYSAGLTGQFANQPEVEAAVRETIGKAYYRLGAADKAEINLDRALMLQRRLYGEHKQVAETMVDCAWASFEQGRLTKGESQARAALDIYQKDGVSGRPVLFALWALEDILHAGERYEESEIVGEQALDVVRNTPDFDCPEVASILHGLAESKNGQSKFAEAEPLARQAVEMHRRLQGSSHPETGWALLALGQALQGQKKFDEAERVDREALAIFRAGHDIAHKSVDEATDYLRQTLDARGDLSEIVAFDQSTLADQRASLGENNPVVAETLFSLADHLRAQGRPPEAEKALQQAVAITRVLLQQTPSWEPPEMLDALKGLASSCYNNGFNKESIALLKQVLALNPQDTEAPSTLGPLQVWFGDDAAYEETRRRFVEQAEGTDHALTADRAAKVFSLRPSTNAVLQTKALKLARRAVELGKTDPYLPWYEFALGLAEYRSGKYAASEQSFRAVGQIADKHPELQATAGLFRAMSLFRQDNDKQEEARKLLAEGEAHMPPLPLDDRKPLVNGKPASLSVLNWWLADKEAKALLDSPSAPK